jgi:hypothetical protein
MEPWIMKIEVPTEHHEQAMTVQWFRRAWPEVIIFAIPNGGARDIRTATKLKIEGVVRGVPDLFIPAWRLWVEMKRTKGGSVSPEQKSFIKYLESVNYAVIVATGAENAKLQIGAFFNQLEKME